MASGALLIIVRTTADHEDEAIVTKMREGR
jgi:hypothetical protein